MGEERAEAIVALCPVATVAVGADGTIVHSNTAAEALLEAGAPLCGQRFLEVAVAEDERGVVAAWLEAARAGALEAPVRARRPHGDGDEVEWRAAREPVEACLLLFATASGERTHAYRELAERAGDAMFIHDLAGRVHYLNPAGRRLFGIAEHAPMPRGLHLAQLVPREHHDRLVAQRNLRLAGDLCPSFLEIEIRDLGGDRRIPIEASSSPILRDGRIDSILVVARDLTERRRSNAALRDSERRLAAMLANLPGAAYRQRIGPRSRRLELVSEGCRALSGYEPEDFVDGRVRLADLLLSADLERVEPVILAAQASAQTYSAEFRIRAADGTVRWIWEKTTASHADDGSDDIIVEGFLTDITERKRAEHQLEERIKELRCLFDVGELLARDDLEPPALLGALARRLAAAFQFPDEVEVGIVLDGHRSPPSPMPREPETDEILVVPIVDVERGRIVVMRRLHRTHDEIPWFAAQGTYFLAEERAMLEVVARRLADWLESRRIAQALRESESRARAIYQGLPIATFVWQHTPDGDFLAVDCNEAAFRLTADAARGVIGMRATELWPDRPELVADLERCLETRSAHRREVDYYDHFSGQRLQLDATFGFVPPDLVLVHIQDLTEQRRTERRLWQAQKLDAIGQLAGGVAHDFNNLLAIINSYTELILDELPASAPMRQDLLEVQAAGERAARLTRQLLAYGRRQFLRPSVLDLNQIVAALRDVLEHVLGEHNRLRLELAPSPVAVCADPTQLDQVLMNLVVNARDAMSDGGGELTLRTALLAPEAVPPGGEPAPAGWVVLECRDSGAGMDEETRSRVFEPFFTTKSLGRGTGLGMATVHGIVHQSGGRIAVDSAPGQGTTFSIWLPRVSPALAAARDPERPADTAPRTGPARVLVVEDDDSLRTLVERVLGNAGYLVGAVASAEEALSWMAEHDDAIDLLLTDVVMPGLGGRILVERLTARLPGLPVIFMSGYTEDVLVRHGQLEPGTHFLAKPFTPSQLERKVEGVLEHARAPRASES